MVFAICRLVLRDREEAEDAAQQTFLSAHGSLLGGTEPQDPAAWLATIARNECRRRRRASGAVVVPLDDDQATLDGDPQRAFAQSEEIELLCQALAELPASQRQAVVLREFYGLSYPEIAAVLGASGPAVESLLFKGRRRLQERLRPLRRTAGILFLPDGVRDALAATIPGFSSGTGTLAAKAVALPLATKVAAAVLAVGVGGGVVVSSEGLHARRGSVDPTPPVATTPSARPAPEGIRATSTLTSSDVVGRRDASGAEPAAQERGDAAGQAESPEQREEPEPTVAPETSEPAVPAEPAEVPETSAPPEPAESAEVPETSEPAEAD